MVNGKDSRQGLASGRPRPRLVAGRTDDTLCEAAEDSPCLRLCCSQLPAPQPESSPGPALGLIAAMSLQEVQEWGLLSPIGEPPCLSPGQKQQKAGEQLRKRRFSARSIERGCCRHSRHFYCRVSTKASNSRTFFSCTASFSGKESKSSAID